MVSKLEEQKLALDIEQDINNKSKLNNIYGPSEPFLFGFIGIMTFLIIFFVFQYFATMDEGIKTNFKYIFCNSSNTDNAGSTSDVAASDNVNFNNSS